VRQNSGGDTRPFLKVPEFFCALEFGRRGAALRPLAGRPVASQQAPHGTIGRAPRLAAGPAELAAWKTTLAVSTISFFPHSNPIANHTAQSQFAPPDSLTWRDIWGFSSF